MCVWCVHVVEKERKRVSVRVCAHILHGMSRCTVHRHDQDQHDTTFHLTISTDLVLIPLIYSLDPSYSLPPPPTTTPTHPCTCDNTPIDVREAKVFRMMSKDSTSIESTVPPMTHFAASSCVCFWTAVKLSTPPERLSK